MRGYEPNLSGVKNARSRNELIELLISLRANGKGKEEVKIHMCGKLKAISCLDINADGEIVLYPHIPE